MTAEAIRYVLLSSSGTVTDMIGWRHCGRLVHDGDGVRKGSRNGRYMFVEERLLLRSRIRRVGHICKIFISHFELRSVPRHMFVFRFLCLDKS